MGKVGGAVDRWVDQGIKWWQENWCRSQGRLQEDVHLLTLIWEMSQMGHLGGLPGTASALISSCVPCLQAWSPSLTATENSYSPLLQLWRAVMYCHLKVYKIISQNYSVSLFLPQFLLSYLKVCISFWCCCVIRHVCYRNIRNEYHWGIKTVHHIQYMHVMH